MAFDVKDRNVLALGMADSGLAAAELLAARGARVTACDRKPLAELPGLAEKLEALGVPFEPQPDAVFEDRDLIVLSPGVPADLPALEAARARGVKVVGDVEMASWFLEGPILGITGSNGKTTVTTLAGMMLEAAGVPCQVGGNIGTPLSEMIAGSRAGQWNVLELSSFQLETTGTFHATIGLALNVTDNHLDRHRTMERYAAAKARLFANQGAGDTAVLNAENEYTRAYAAQTRGDVVWFSPERRLEEGFGFDSGRLLAYGEPFLEAAELRVRGRHNAGNVLAAAAAAYRAGASLEAIAEAARRFTGLEHRLEFVRTLAGVSYFNDSKATTVASALAALASFDEPLWVILGGREKHSDFRPLRAPLLERARGVLLIGEATAKIAGHLGAGLPLRECGDLAGALGVVRAEARPGDVALLAPACASFDQFRSFEHRGQAFKALVREMEV
jgi:UDP-N-acetylmuramoylalanine--D-glutamate ligase